MTMCAWPWGWLFLALARPWGFLFVVLGILGWILMITRFFTIRRKMRAWRSKNPSLD